MALNELTFETFKSLTGKSFVLANTDLKLELTSVDSLPENPTSERKRRSFTLTFVGHGFEAHAQGLYELDNPRTGLISIFLVPVGMDGDACLFEAVFN
jgi:hypothetical protein